MAPPKTPHDLARHRCINFALANPWRTVCVGVLKKEGHALNARVEGQCVFSTSTPILRAALAGFGIAYLPEDMVAPHLADGSLQAVLQDWWPTFPGYHLYYPSRRQAAPGIRVADGSVALSGAIKERLRSKHLFHTAIKTPRFTAFPAFPSLQARKFAFRWTVPTLHSALFAFRPSKPTQFVAFAWQTALYEVFA